MLSVARFLHGYLRHPAQPVAEEEIRLPLGTESVEGTIVRPLRRGVYPGWIVLHGITVPGRSHPGLSRFARSIASTGAVVLMPDVPAWRELRIDPQVADATIRASARHLMDRGDVDHDDIRLVGFSFGATQSLISAADPELRDTISSVIAFGGYCDLHRTVRCNLTGEHEWGAQRHQLDPDPYGRWIAAGNYLTRIPGMEAMDEVQRAAHALALEAGRLGVYAADAIYDPFKAAQRERLSAEQREVWDLLAPPAGAPVRRGPARELAGRLANAMLRTHPELDPASALPRLERRIVLAHGRDDRLIPYTEMLRLQELISPRAELHADVTRLFAHSREADRLRTWEYPYEVGRYIRMLHCLLRRS